MMFAPYIELLDCLTNRLADMTRQAEERIEIQCFLQRLLTFLVACCIEPLGLLESDKEAGSRARSSCGRLSQMLEFASQTALFLPPLP